MDKAADLSNKLDYISIRFRMIHVACKSRIGVGSIDELVVRDSHYVASLVTEWIRRISLLW